MNTPASSQSSQLLAEQLLEQLQGSPLQQIAQQLGTDQMQAQSAVEMALPLLLGALGRNAQEPQGADALFGALQRDHLPAAPQQALGLSGGMDLGGLLGSVLGGGASSGLGAGGGAGAAILGHIFGGGRERVESSLGQTAGLGANAGPLLQMLAPIVMSFLAQRVSAGGMDSGGLGQMLGQERAQSTGTPGGNLLASLLDQDGDGQLGLGDLVKIGAGLLGGRR